MKAPKEVAPSILVRFDMSEKNNTLVPNTLTSFLAKYAEVNGHRIAYRHKQLGIWNEVAWHELLDSVSRIAAGLKQLGFQPEDTLFVISNPRPETVVLSLAAQWLGGTAAPIDPHIEDSDLAVILQQLKPNYVFAEDLQQIDRTTINHLPNHLIYADKRGVNANAETNLLHLSELISTEDAVRQTKPNQVAFSFFRVNQHADVETTYLSHAEIISAGTHVVEHEKLHAKDEAFASRTFAYSGHARFLLGPWLVAGFALNFPENLATRDVDRREIGPTIVAGTKETYERLARIVRGRLPQSGFRHALVSWALSPHRSIFLRWIKQKLVLQSLKDVIGFSRTSTPLIVGADLSEDSRLFFAQLGIEIRHWPEESAWSAINKEKTTNFSQHAPQTTRGQSLRLGTGNI